MFRDYMKTRLAVFLAVLALPGGLVAGVCLTPEDATSEDPLETGFVVAIQSDQGQGSIDCSAFTGPGGEMFEIEVDQDQSRGSVSDPIIWTVPDDAVAHPDAEDPLVHVDILFVSSSDGARCTQHLSGNARSGVAAAGTKRKVATLIACSDGKVESVIPAPIPPVSTSDNCNVDTESAKLQTAINGNGKYDVVIAIGRGDKGDNTAICSNTTGLGAQKRCVDQCITPDAASTTVEYDPGASECTVDSIFYPMKCRACELSFVIDSDPFSADPTQFCWEQLQKVDLDDPMFLPTLPYLKAGSFKKAPGPKSNQVWKVDEYAGSTCYKISGTTDYGYRYAYWVPSGCPK